MLDELIKNAKNVKGNILTLGFANNSKLVQTINNNKKVIVVPRLAKYKEHINDHQMQITYNFSKEGYILPLYDI